MSRRRPTKKKPAPSHVRTRRGRPRSASPASPPTQRGLLINPPLTLTESLTRKVIRRKGRRPGGALGEAWADHPRGYPLDAKGPDGTPLGAKRRADLICAEQKVPVTERHVRRLLAAERRR